MAFEVLAKHLNNHKGFLLACLIKLIHVLFLFVFSLVQTLVATLVKIEPWFILTYGAGIIGNILTVPYPEHIHTEIFGEGRISLTTYSATIPEGLAILGLYFIVTVVLGLLLFERKEFT